MKRAIKASNEPYPIQDLEDMKQYLISNIKEINEWNIIPGFTVDTGDGEVYLILDDQNTGDFHGMKIPNYSTEVGYQDVANKVLESWEVETIQ